MVNLGDRKSPLALQTQSWSVKLGVKMSQPEDTGIKFAGLVDLLDSALGGEPLMASDEFFAGKENLNRPGRGIFLPDEYTDRGKWMDGWEPKRRRAPGHDWCILKLSVPGVIKVVNIDTNHFLGNHAPYASVQGCYAPNASPKELRDQIHWQPVVDQTMLSPGSENIALSHSNEAYTHLRLSIYPAGGVSRFRAWGEAQPTQCDSVVELSGLLQGGTALACSDMFFSSMNNLLKPYPAANMGDGWETKRSRPPTDDWVIIRLGRPGTIERVVIDTAFFKGNYPDSAQLYAVCWPDAPPWALVRDVNWTAVTERIHLRADSEHHLEVGDERPWTHVKLHIVPDGGISRLKVFGQPTTVDALCKDNSVRAFNDLDTDSATDLLTQCCGSKRWAEGMVENRPYVSLDHLFGQAREVWWHLGDGDWLEAFGHHPEIGADIQSLRKKFEKTAALSEAEQAGVAAASDAELQGLARLNKAYKERFGFLFIICATGKSAAFMLKELTRRVENEAAEELRIAAGEQVKITELRLKQMLSSLAD